MCGHVYSFPIIAIETLFLKACKVLLGRAQFHFGSNLGKFQLYAAKNVFYSNQPTKEAKSTTEGLIQTSSNDQMYISSENNDLDRTLQRLRNQYAALHADYIQYASECRDMDALLKDMRTSLFNLRVAIQSFDDYEIQPLSETTQILNQYQSQLQHYGQEAEGACHGDFIIFCLIPFHLTDLLERMSALHADQKLFRKVFSTRGKVLFVNNWWQRLMYFRVIRWRRMTANYFDAV